MKGFKILLAFCFLTFAFAVNAAFLPGEADFPGLVEVENIDVVTDVFTITPTVLQMDYESYLQEGWVDDYSMVINFTTEPLDYEITPVELQAWIIAKTESGYTKENYRPPVTDILDLYQNYDTNDQARVSVGRADFIQDVAFFMIS